MHRTATMLVAAVVTVATATRGNAQEAVGPTKLVPLKVDLALDGAIAAGSLAAWGVWGLLDNRLAPKACRWCSSNRLDERVRNALVWRDPGKADTISTVIAVGVTAGSAVYTVARTYSTDGTTAAVENGVLWSEVLGVTGLLTASMKYASARARPRTYYGHGTGSGQDNLSFWSGHAATVFSAAAATGTLARLRGSDDWVWLYAVGLAGAATQVYFRVSGDMHWLTDTMAGAAVGTAVGMLIPWLHRSGAGHVTFQVVPTADGMAVAGAF